MAAVHRHHQIGRLGLGGQTGGRAAALDVDHDQRKLKAHGEPEGFALERNTRATGGRDADVAAIARAEGGADGGDLVFGLEGPDAEVLVLRQLVKDVARRRDRIRAEEQREAGLLACGDQAPTQGGVAVDVRVRAGRELRRANRHPAGGELSGLAEGISCPVRRFVRGDHEVAALELLLDPQHGRLFGPGVQPRHEPQGEEVLGPFRIPRLHAEVLAGLFGERGHRRRDHGVAVEGVVLERIVLVPGLGKVALFEGVGVDDDGTAALERVEISLECRRVHCDQHVRGIARGGDVVVGDVDLER